MEWSGTDWTGQERTGLDGKGEAFFQASTVEGTGMDRIGMERIGEAFCVSTSGENMSETIECESEKFPFDVATLRKGMRIEPERLESLSGLRRGTSQFAFKLLTWSRWIEDRTVDTMTPLICRISNDGIEIMTDADASEYLRDQFESGAAKMRRSHRRSVRVDIAGLTDQQRGEHLLEQQRMASRLQADKAARKRLNIGASMTQKKLTTEGGAE
jgi:hypothetical protein